MDTVDWQVLQEINRHKSLSKAAESLFLSQSAITYRVNKIEEEFGKPLFIRGRNGTQLNQNGMKLLTFASRMIQFDKDVRQTMQMNPGADQADIEIGTTGNFFNLHHVHQIKAFTQRHPNIRLSIQVEPSGVQYKKIKEGRLMVGVMREQHLMQWEEEQFMVFNDPLMIAAKEPISEEYLMRTPMIRNYTNPYLSNIINEWTMNMFERMPVANYIDVVGDSRNVVAMICAGLGWGILTESRLEQADHLFLKPINKPDGTPYRLNTYLLYRQDALNYQPYAAYIDHFCDYFTRQREVGATPAR